MFENGEEVRAAVERLVDCAERDKNAPSGLSCWEVIQLMVRAGAHLELEPWGELVDVTGVDYSF